MFSSPGGGSATEHGDDQRYPAGQDSGNNSWEVAVNHIRILRHYVSIHYIVLALLEFLLLLAAVYLAVFTRFFSTDPEFLEKTLELVGPRAVLYALIMVLSTVAMGVYQSRDSEGLLGMTLRTLVSYCLLGTVLLSAIFYLVPTMELFLGRGVMAIATFYGLAFVTLLRLAYYTVVSADAMKRRVMIVGAGQRAATLLGHDQSLARENHVIHGFLPTNDDVPLVNPETVLDIPPGKLLQYVIDNGIDELVVAVDDRRRDSQGRSFPLEELLDCKLSGFNVTDDVSFIEREEGKIDIRALNASWMIFSDGFSHRVFVDYAERLFDILASLLLLLVAWPFMLLTALAIKLEDGFRAPVFYSQERVGLNGKCFMVHKFRSMRIDAEAAGQAVWAQKNDSRITRVGNVIRNTRIDELPQILNVLKGEMSFVGPRPERPQFVDQLAEKIPYFRERHRVRPGITGWAQLCYPYGASDEDAKQKLQYDLYYIKNRSLLLDLVILLRTVEVILIGKGVR